MLYTRRVYNVNMTYVNFGGIIKESRERLGWDQATLAKTMQVKQQSVSRWEKGQSRPDVDVVAALAEVLHIEVDGLLSAAGYDLPKPVRPLLQVLPLASLTAEKFELFCRAFVAALNPGADVSRYGSQGDTQEGIDLYSKKGVKILDYQCKRHQQFGPSDIDQAVKDTSFESEHHHLLLSRKATPGARKAINKYNNWSLWDIEDISAKIQQELPKDKALRIVDTFFPGWRKDFLGEEDPSPWLTSEDFFGPLTNRVMLFNHDWSFVGRQPELKILASFVSSEADRVIIISGRGGVGKSRLLRAFSEQTSRTEILFTSSSTDIKPKDFELLPNVGVLVIDDAHENPDLSQLLNAIAVSRPELKLVISTRPYGLPQIQHDLTRSGFGFNAEDILRLKDLTTEEAKSLAEEIIIESGGDTAHAQKIAEITKDCPLATVIGSRLVATGKVKPELLNNSDKFREHILMTFRNVITGEIGGSKGSEDVRCLLEFVAMIQPVDPRDPAFEAAASIFLERRYDKILRDLRELEDAGVLLRRRNRLRIAPDLLADYIRADVAYDSQNARPTGFAYAVFKAVKDDLATNLLVNLSQLDWRISATGVQTELLDSVWADLEAQFRSAAIYRRQTMLKALEKVAYYQPVQALSFVKIAIDEPTDEIESDDALVRYLKPSYSDVLSKVSPVLKYVGYNHEYLPQVLDLLKDLAERDKRQPNQYPEHPMRILSDLAGIEPGKPLLFNETVVNHVIGWLSDSYNKNFSPFDVLDKMLATEGHQSEVSGITVTLKAFMVRAEVVAGIRERIVDAAFKAVYSKDLRTAKRAMRTIGESLQNPWGTNVTDQDRAQWEPGQIQVLNRLKGIAADSKLDPYLMVEVRGAVSWHAVHSKGATQAAAKAVLEAIPTTIEYELPRVLADGWGHTFERTGDYTRNEADFIAWRENLASNMLAENDGNFAHLISQLEERIKTLHEMEMTRHGDGGQFIATLAIKSPDFGKALAGYILKNLQSSLANYFGSVLMALAGSDYASVIKFAEAALESKDPELPYRVSWALGWGMRGVPVSSREIIIIQTLMSSDVTQVRRNIIRVVERFEPSHKAKVIEMLLAMKFSDNMELADEVLGQFGEHGAFKVEDLSESQVDSVTAQLVKIDSIEDHNINEFLVKLSVVYPDQTLKLLMDRVEYRERHEHKTDYKPLPYALSHGASLQFYKTPSYEKLLRSVRDWSAEKTDNWIRPHFGPDLFKAVSAGFDEVTLRVLHEWVMSSKQKNIEAAASLLSEVNRAFLWDNPDYIVDMLNQAQQHGEECYKRVGSHLHTIAFQGGRSGIPGQPFPEDIDQRDKSQAMMKELPAGSPGYRFYKSLYEAAIGNIKRDTIDEEDLFDD